MLASRAICFYFAEDRLAGQPDLHLPAQRWNIDASVWWQYLFLAAILAVLDCSSAGLPRRNQEPNRGPLAAFLIFAGTLFPALGFISVFPFIYSYVADHFQYLATVGMIVPLVAGLALASRRITPRVTWLPPLAAALLLTTLGTLTWRQSTMYRDLATLYRVTIARNPDAWMAHNNLAYLLLSAPGGLPEAMSHLQTALRLHPAYAEAHLNLGIAYSLKARSGRKRSSNTRRP